MLRSEGAQSGPQLWIKRDDQTGSLTSGNKVRKLEFLLAEARAQGCDTLITSGGVQSNHCRATAVLGTQLGFRVHLLCCAPTLEPQPVGNLLIDQLVDARISHYSPQEFRKLDSLFAHWQTALWASRAPRPTAFPPAGSNGTGLWGYIAAARGAAAGLSSSQGISPSHIIHATGSGGTQAGLTLGCSLLGMDTQVEGLCCPVITDALFQTQGDRGYSASGLRAEFGGCRDRVRCPL